MHQTSTFSPEDEGRPSEVALDALDRQIIVALQASPRASWRQLATVIERSESTVKRRAERLIELGVVRITAFAEHVSHGFPVLMQFTCDFAHGPQVARQLAERDDVRFVAFVTGPFDVVAELIIPSHARLTDFVLNELPAIPGIRSTSTETVLRTFKRSYDWSRDLLHSRGESEPLLPTAGEMEEPILLDHISLRVLDGLKANGRAGYAELAERCDISESVARYRAAQLLTKGGIRIVSIVDPRVLGYDVQILIWLRLDLARRQEAAAMLAAHPTVRFVAATSGYSDLVCETFLRSNADIYDFSDQVLGKLPGVQQINIATELLTVKRGDLRLDR